MLVERRQVVLPITVFQHYGIRFIDMLRVVLRFPAEWKSVKNEGERLIIPLSHPMSPFFDGVHHS